MLTQTTDRKPVLIAVLLLSFLLLALFAGCGGGEEESASGLSIDELWSKVQEADAGTDSMHMEIVSYYENTQYGEGQSLSTIMDFNADDYHEQRLLLGQVYFESIRVGDKYYEKEADSDWQELPVESASDAGTEYTSRFQELPSMATSQERLGTESIDGREAEHLHFVLDVGGVSQLFSAQASYDLSQCEGGEIDVWIDSSWYYLLRYDLVIHNVPISEDIGYGDVRFVVNIRDINEPIEITPPV